MIDKLVRGGQVIDGTGRPPFRADIGICDGRIVAVGEVDESARSVIDASDLMIAPGFVDPHTHYDAQLFWDPLATPSTWHGVTTVIAGNCGFTLAPVHESDLDFTRRMMAHVEGMPLAALEHGPPWSWESFSQYLDALDGDLGVNVGMMVGHCALRRYVMGEDCAREADPEELERIASLLATAIAAGGLGLSTTRSFTHNDGDGDPVPSRYASDGELLRLCDVVGQFEGTSLEMITPGVLHRFSDEESNLLAAMSATARRPLNWNILNLDSSDPDKLSAQLRPSRLAREKGGRVVALTMPIFSDLNQSFARYCTLWVLPVWRDLFALDIPARMEQLRDPGVRARMVAAAEASTIPREMTDFARFRIGEVVSHENKALMGRMVGEIACELGATPFDTLVDIVLRDKLQTDLWPTQSTDSPVDWALRCSAWLNEDVLLGGSDAGAHVDRLMGSSYPTRFLADCLRGRQLVPVEDAVRLMTDTPARLFGIQNRGRIEPAFHADLMIFDPATVDAGMARLSSDLPGNSSRLVADPQGVEYVVVGGSEVLVSGQPTGLMPGGVLRSGRDTAGTSTVVDG